MGTTMGKNGGHFLDALPSQATLHVVMLGLDSAGKTTALYRLKFDQYLNTVPTIGFNCEKIQGTAGRAKGIHFLIWDVGGQEKLRPLWRSYTRCTDGILFVVDSVDVERMEEAKMELLRMAKCPDNQQKLLLHVMELFLSPLDNSKIQMWKDIPRFNSMLCIM
ncbi:ADP-ribosylation factor-like protein 4A isoform X2 [Glossina fuscipes]|uniref:small monomeric GTPase n=1 Tax=Glossina fuscipes TaxID=7396 RepID=A0A9C5ZPA1_9MUSC|nr:ADP-ribosylation factor-like protein 4A isoform X2 [Glossina fuscipes]